MTREQDLTGDYVLDVGNTRLGFVAKHVMVARVHGTFERFRGTAHINLLEPSRSNAQIEVETASVSTGVNQRDAHLRTGDFFDAPHHPLMTYRSVAISRIDPTAFRVLGDLTIRGVTNRLAMVLRYHGATADTAGDFRMSFTGTTVISRRDYGVAFGAVAETAGGVVIADEVMLELDLSLVRVSPSEPSHDPGSTSGAVVA